MDSRRKILTAEQAIHCVGELRQAGVMFNAISGYFDILQASMLRRINALAAPGFKIFAVVLDPENPVSAAAARLELAASLRVIDYVVHCQTGPEEFVRQLRPAEWIREEAAHLAGTERLIQHVLERHGRVVSREASH